MSDAITIRIKDNQHTNAQRVTVDTSDTIGDIANAAAHARKLPMERHYTLSPEGKGANAAFRRMTVFTDSGIEPNEVLDLVQTMQENTDPPPPAPAKKTTVRKKTTGRKKTTARGSRKKTTARGARRSNKKGVRLDRVNAIRSELDALEDEAAAGAEVVAVATKLHAALSKTFESPLLDELAKALEKHGAQA